MYFLSDRVIGFFPKFTVKTQLIGKILSFRSPLKSVAFDLSLGEGEVVLFFKGEMGVEWRKRKRKLEAEVEAKSKRAEAKN